MGLAYAGPLGGGVSGLGVPCCEVRIIIESTHKRENDRSDIVPLHYSHSYQRDSGGKVLSCTLYYRRQTGDCTYQSCIGHILRNRGLRKETRYIAVLGRSLLPINRCIQHPSHRRRKFLPGNGFREEFLDTYLSRAASEEMLSLSVRYRE